MAQIRILLPQTSCCKDKRNYILMSLIPFQCGQQWSPPNQMISRAGLNDVGKNPSTLEQCSQLVADYCFRTGGWQARVFSCNPRKAHWKQFLLECVVWKCGEPSALQHCWGVRWWSNSSLRLESGDLEVVLSLSLPDQNWAFCPVRGLYLSSLSCKANGLVRLIQILFIHKASGIVVSTQCFWLMKEAGLSSELEAVSNSSQLKTFVSVDRRSEAKGWTSTSWPGCVEGQQTSEAVTPVL